MKRPENHIKITVLDYHSPQNNKGRVQSANPQGTWSVIFLKLKISKMTAENWIISMWQHDLEARKVATSKTAVKCTTTKLVVFLLCVDTDLKTVASICKNCLLPWTMVSKWAIWIPRRRTHWYETMIYMYEKPNFNCFH